MAILSDLDLLKTLGQVAAPAGIAIGSFLFLGKDIVARNIFPILTKEKAYRVIMALIFMAWSIALAGIIAWVYVENNKFVPDIIESDEIKIQQPVIIQDGKSNKPTEAPLPIVKLASKEFGVKNINDNQCDNKNKKLDPEVYLYPKFLYFPTDSKELSKKNKRIVKESIFWMTQFGNRICGVYVIGFIDDKSTREYSLGIAMRLANTVKTSLIMFGINEEKINSLSFGKEVFREVFVQTTEKELDENLNNFVAIGIRIYE